MVEKASPLVEVDHEHSILPIGALCHRLIYLIQKRLPIPDVSTRMFDNFASLYQQRKDYPKALAMYERALDLGAALPGKTHATWQHVDTDYADWWWFNVKEKL